MEVKMEFLINQIKNYFNKLLTHKVKSAKKYKIKLGWEKHLVVKKN